MLLANVAIETILRLYADTLPDALRLRVYELTNLRSILLCRGMQGKRGGNDDAICFEQSR